MNTQKQIKEKITFEDFRNENGMTYWWATDLMTMLGYKSMKSFQKVLDNVTKALSALDILYYENIIAEERSNNGKSWQDFRLTRFACYLAVMNGDPKKKEVAEAQVYFANQTRKFELYMKDNSQIKRMLIREDLSEGNKSLASIVKQSGVTDFSKFQNAGYLGMYNMEAWKLKARRKIIKGSLIDQMGRAELAANLFRVTQTEERIKRSHIKGQQNLEQTHFEVGRDIRKIIINNTGKTPETLPMEKQIEDIKSELKKGQQQMLKEDDLKTKK
ncbi:BRO family protein [Flavobacterium sp.]|uniref:BRO family protein n=1 Tax=Flavobacterium sp. TaxID=239 RepID=UPI003D6ADEF5